MVGKLTFGPYSSDTRFEAIILASVKVNNLKGAYLRFLFLSIMLAMPLGVQFPDSEAPGIVRPVSGSLPPTALDEAPPLPRRA